MPSLPPRNDTLAARRNRLNKPFLTCPTLAGDACDPARRESARSITSAKNGREVNIRLKGTNMQWFRKLVGKLIWIDRKE
jgi:hypothetical protein